MLQALADTVQMVAAAAATGEPLPASVRRDVIHTARSRDTSGFVFRADGGIEFRGKELRFGRCGRSLTAGDT